MDEGERPLTVLALVGSLRATSSNLAALGAASRLAPALGIVAFDGLRAIPPFDPDDDTDPAPAAVADLRLSVAAADGLLISCPEYARGVPGAFKNALDWLVSGPEMPGKPVMLINTAPRATHAQAALALILRTMSALLVEAAFVTLPLQGRMLDADAIVRDAELAALLRDGLDVFGQAIRAGRTGGAA